MLRKSIKLILEILSPRYCAGCKKSNESLCAECVEKSFKFGGSCIFCNQRNGTGKICAKCQSIDISKYQNIDRVIWAGEYNNALKNSIKELKYKKRKELAEVLGQLIFKKFREYYPKYKKENFVVIPIPMHPKKKHERGYNQAELLALEFGKLSGIMVFANLLFKEKETKKQVETKTKEERIKNLDGAFKVKGQVASINNKMIIFIDDVATTGATFLHASRAIQKTPPFDEGGIKIICLAVAHGYG